MMSELMSTQKVASAAELSLHVVLRMEGTGIAGTMPG